MAFTVATWNLQWQFGDHRARQPAITATLRELDADVVMVQESWPAQVDALAQQFGFEQIWAGYRADEPDRGMGNAILSRWPIRSHEHRFLADARGREYRTIIGAQIETPWGTLWAFTTHLEHRFDQSATRQEQLAQASAFIEETVTDGALPPILAGDLNAVHDSDEIRRLTGRSAPYEQGRVWTDAWEQVGDAEGITWSLDNPYINDSAWPNRRLDYVLIGWPRDDRPRGNPQSASLFGTEPIDGTVPSDHYGVAVRIRT